MAFFKRSAVHNEEVVDEVEVVPLPALPATPPETINGVRDFWQHWDYLLSMVNELGEFGVSVLDSVGLTLNEPIIAESDVSAQISAGDVLIEKGSRVEPRMLAVMTEMGIRKVMAHPSPRILVMALSQEATSASFLAAAQAAQAGAQVHRVEAFAESASQLVHSIDEQLVRADLVVTIGGLESSDIDMRDIAAKLGPHDFTPVAISPGGLHGFIMAEGKVPLLALPSDPYATFVLTKLILEPMIAKLMGATTDPELFSAYLAQPLRIIPDTLTCVPAMVKEARMTITGLPRGLEGLATIYTSNALAILASEDGLVNKDTEAFYLPLK